MNDHIDYFECSCFSSDHLLRLYHIDNDIYLSVFLNTCSLFNKLINGFKYLFNIQNYDGMFDSWILNDSDKRKFITCIQGNDKYPLYTLDIAYINNPNTGINNIKIYRGSCGINDNKYWFNVIYDTELKMMSINVELAYSRSFWTRLYKTIKYVSGFCPFSYEWKLTKEDIMKLYECAKLCSIKGER